MEISSFEYRGKTYTLKTPLPLRIENRCAINDDLGIMVILCEGVHNQIEEEAKQQLADLWAAYTECSEVELSSHGLAFKRKLQEMIL